MPVSAALNTVYAILVQQAREADMWAKEPRHRQDLDDALRVIDPEEEVGETNVVELAAFVNKVNRASGLV